MRNIVMKGDGVNSQGTATGQNKCWPVLKAESRMPMTLQC